MESRRLCSVLAVVLAGAVGAAFALPPVPVKVLVKQGDTIGASTVSTVNSPFTDGNGRVGFVGSIADSQRFVWHDTGPVFFSNDALPVVLTGGESTMGVSDTGGFIYSPSADGNDAVWTHGGLLLAKEQPVPNYPNLISTFNSRPQMIPNGTAFWMGGTRTSAQTTTSNRSLFKAADPTDPNSITAVLSGGDVIDGKTLKTSASNFTYWISDNGAHHIHKVEVETGSTSNDVHIYLDGGFVAQEGQPSGAGDNWQNFSTVSVNNAGHYLVSGDTDAATATDAFLAYDGSIAIREGDTLDGVLLGSGYAVRDASINDLGGVVHMWGTGTTEFLFYGEGTDLAASQLLLATGNELDVDNDGISDYLLTDFEASATIGPGLDLAEDGWVYVEVGMEPITGGSEIAAILRVAIPEPGTLSLLALGGLALLRRR